MNTNKRLVDLMSGKKRVTKKDIYACYGIKFDGEHIESPYGPICPVLINGNTKLGHGVYTFSMLPTNDSFTVRINDEIVTVKGTCPCHCVGCYATCGKYNCDNVKESNARKTLLSRYYLAFLKACIIAQIHADNIKFVRIHASGDFESAEYIQMWIEICLECPDTIFWSYTKNKAAENAFDDVPNCNIVKSLLPNGGLNFGHCDYILEKYNELKQAGKKVYICRCGIDKNQHCNDCKGCSVNDYVLFIEHGTSYRPKKDPCYNTLKTVIESQAKPF